MKTPDPIWKQQYRVLIDMHRQSARTPIGKINAGLLFDIAEAEEKFFNRLGNMETLSVMGAIYLGCANQKDRRVFAVMNREMRKEIKDLRKRIEQLRKNQAWLLRKLKAARKAKS